MSDKLSWSPVIRSSTLLFIVFALSGILTGCAALKEARVGAPKELWLGPLTDSCNRAIEYAGTPDSARGIARAEQAVAINDLVIVLYGTRIVMLPRPLYDEKYDAFLSAHGIRYEDGDHMFPPWGEHYAYNCRMDQEIQRRHGVDFWVRADAQARAI